MITLDVDALADAVAERLQAEPATSWLTVNEAAEHVRCHHSWIRARLNEVPHVRVDGKILIDRRELDGWLLTYRT